MKIKHWQGYGAVNAKVIGRSLSTLKNEKTVTIKVWGNHEYGLETNDSYHIANWLGRKSLGNFEYNDIKSVSVEDNYENENGETIEVAIYTITLEAHLR